MYSVLACVVPIQTRVLSVKAGSAAGINEFSDLTEFLSIKTNLSREDIPFDNFSQLCQGMGGIITLYLVCNYKLHNFICQSCCIVLVTAGRSVMIL